jgi:aconitate hydratase
VQAVIAESFERIHRSNLLGMGVLPLEFTNGVTRSSLALDGSETVDVAGIAAMHAPRQLCRCTITRADGRRESIDLLARLDTNIEVQYFLHGGIMNYVLRRRLANAGEGALQRA